MAGGKSRRAVRIANLRREVEALGGPAAFARTHQGVDETYVSQLLTGHRNFGDVAAENMEERCGWPPLYLDRQTDEPAAVKEVADSAEAIARAWIDLPGRQRIIIKQLLARFAEQDVDADDIGITIGAVMAGVPMELRLERLQRFLTGLEPTTKRSRNPQRKR